MRQRVEDLGRISTLVKFTLDHEVFSIYGGREKDFTDYFYRLDEDNQMDTLRKLIYGLSDIKDQFYEIGTIADGTDSLNESYGIE